MVRAKQSKLAAEVGLEVSEFRKVSKEMKKSHCEAQNADVQLMSDEMSEEDVVEVFESTKSKLSRK